MRGEEKIFYPRPEQEEKTRGKILESHEEYHVAKEVSKELGSTSTAEERWPSKLAVMNEITGHHLEEEQKNVFKPAQKCSITLKRKNWIGKFMEEKRSSWKEGSSVTRLQKE